MNIKDIIMGIAIIILTIFVTVYGINAFYPGPEYEDFCEDIKTQEIIETAERCEEIGGKWNAYDREIPIEEDDLRSKGFCDRDYYCRQEYQKEREKYSKNVFLITIPLGLLILAGGAIFFSLEAVGFGLMGGGVGTFIFGVGGYWSYAGNILKFIVSLLGLIVLIGFTYWLNKRKSKKKR